MSSPGRPRSFTWASALDEAQVRPARARAPALDAGAREGARPPGSVGFAPTTGADGPSGQLVDEVVRELLGEHAVLVVDVEDVPPAPPRVRAPRRRVPPLVAVV